MSLSIKSVLGSLLAAISITPGIAQAQAPTPLLVLEVPVELRTLSPDVVQVFLECSLTLEYASEPITLGTTRSQLRLIAEPMGGRVSEVVNVSFHVEDMIGRPSRPEAYQCRILLGARDRVEWPAVAEYATPLTDTTLEFAPEYLTAPGWARMQWSDQRDTDGLIRLVGGVDVDIGFVLQQAWEVGQGTKGNNDQGDPE